jgi:non-ribosomal peptide synthetase component F
VLPIELETALRSFVNGRRLPLRAVLCAAWAACLARHAERSDFTIGQCATGRTFDGLEELLGTFQRFLPVGVNLDAKVNLAKLARLVDESAAQGEEWFEFFDTGSAPDDPFRYAFEFLEPVASVEAGKLGLELLRRGE